MIRDGSAASFWTPAAPCSKVDGRQSTRWSERRHLLAAYRSVVHDLNNVGLATRDPSARRPATRAQRVVTSALRHDAKHREAGCGGE